MTGILIIKLSVHNEFEILGLIKLAIGSPTPEKMQKILNAYNEPDHHLFGYYNQEELVGLIGLQIRGTHGIIKHIAIENAHQKQGIGKELVTEGINDLGLKTCETETDEEGKGFYEKCNFECVPFKGKYNMRYRCKWEKP